MPFTPDQPFPKSPGNPIMAKDWNDAIGEVQRLDTAKVNRAGADALVGPLTIANALAVGTAAAASAGTSLHVVGTNSPAVARLQTTAVNGSARLELWSDPRGTANEWRPGYIESFNAGSYTGGLRFVTNGTGAAAKQGAAEQLRLVNGAAGFGVTDPAYRIDANGRIRIRQGTAAAPSAGLYLHQATPNANRAFIGMMNDSTVGLYGGTGTDWGLQMDTSTGNVTQVATTSPAVLRLQSRASFGAARVELWSDPPGSLNEWRPAFIESIDGGSFKGGLRIVTNGQGSGSKTGEVEQLRISNGVVGVGVQDPAFRLDVGGRIRLREGGGPAGLWLYSSTASAPNDRAFIGLYSDTSVGLWGSTGAGWGLRMDTTTGNVTIPGRVWAGNVHVEARTSGQVSTNSGSWVQVPNMSVTFTLEGTRPVWFNFHLPGVRITGGTGNYTVGFRLMLGTTQLCYNVQYMNNTSGTMKAQSIVLTRLASVTTGTHTVRAEWFVGHTSITVLACETGVGAGGDRVLQVVEL